MRVLLTRPLEDSLRTAALLHQRHVDSIIEPLFDPVDCKRVFDDLTIYQALVFTSRHAVRFFATHNAFPLAPVLCVGNETAALAMKLGATDVRSANGNAADLAKLVTMSCTAEKGPILRLKCRMTTDPLVEKLAQGKFAIEEAVIYDVLELHKLSNDHRQIIKYGPLDGVLFYSPGNAASFARLMKQFSLTKACRRLHAWCISEPTANALSPLTFKSVTWAAKPTQDSLLDLFSAPSGTTR